MPDLGIGEAIAGLFGGGDLLGALFGGGAAATDVAAGAGAADLAALAGTSAPTAALGSGLLGELPAATEGFGAAADLAATQAAGTGLATGVGDLAAPGIAGLSGITGEVAGTAGPTFLGTAADALAPGVAGGFGSSFAAPAVTALDSSVFTTGAAPVFDASGLAGGGGAAGVVGADNAALSSISSLLGPTAQTPSALSGGTAFGMPDAFSGSSALGFAPQTGAGAGISPSIAPAGGAAGAAAPASVTGPVDATALSPGSQVFGGSGAITAGGPAGPTALTGAPSTIDQLLGKAGTGAIESLTKNPLGIALGAGGLGYSLYKGMQDTANQKALAADAAMATQNSNQMVASGEALQQYLTSGTLPPQYITQVKQAIADAKTAAISNAASQGLSTDPNQNTALATTLAKIDQQQPGMISQIAAQLFTSGSSLINSGMGAAGLSGQLYQALVQNDTAQAANTGKAIAALAAALNGKSQGTIGGSNITISPV